MIPFILAGGIANALMNLPIPAYQALLVSEHFSWIYSVLDMIYEGTFGLFSLGLVITLSISFAMEKSEPVDQGALYVIISLGAYGAQLNIGSSHFDLNNIGTPVFFSGYMATGSFRGVFLQTCQRRKNSA